MIDYSNYIQPDPTTSKHRFLSSSPLIDKEMAYNGRAHPECLNAANPYHECGVVCLEKISQGQGRKEKKSGVLRMPSFGKKQKESESVGKSPRVVNNASFVKSVHSADTASPRSPYPVVKSVQPAENASPRLPYFIEKKVELENSQSSYSTEQHSEESYLGNNSLDKGQGPSPESLSTSGNVTAYIPKSTSRISLACFGIPTPTDQEDEDSHASPEAVSPTVAKKVKEGHSGPIVKSMNFSSSGISRASEENDESDAQSVISDSCVSVGKYHVRANVASILQFIFINYGDIAANYRLESASLRAYYLECLCSVVQQLQSTPVKQLTKTKVKEMVAVVKDVETAGIDVTWLNAILDELTEATELISQHETAKVAKASCDNAIESTNNELESMTKDLAEKEKAAAEAKARIEEARTRLSELELQSSELSQTISSIGSKVEKTRFKPLGDQML